MNLQPPAGTARLSPAAWWSLTPPSHPYPRATTGKSRNQPVSAEAVVLFCLHLLSPVACTFTSGASCAARTFLSCHRGTSDRPERCFPTAKLLKTTDMAKQKGRFLSEAIVLQAFPAKQLLLLQKNRKCRHDSPGVLTNLLSTIHYSFCMQRYKLFTDCCIDKV